MTARPLGYESQKFILQYMDPNTRLLLNQKCPSLRVPNKMAPLHISNAHLTPFNLTINNTFYRLGVLTYFDRSIDEKASEWLTSRNNLGGVQRNHGLENQLAVYNREYLKKEVANWQMIENEMEEKRKRVAKIEKVVPLRKLYAQTPKSLRDTHDLVEEMELLKGQISDHELSPPPIPLEYTNYVQLTINSPGRGSVVERINYRESLSKILFGTPAAMTTRPLGYESQKFILQYMDPNMRFQLNQKCPFLRVINKITPLHISEAGLTPFNLTINDTIYRLGVLTLQTDKLIDQWVNRGIAQSIREENEASGVQSNHAFDQQLEYDCQRYTATGRKEWEYEIKMKKVRVSKIERTLPMQAQYAQSPEILSYYQKLIEEMELLKGQISELELNPPQIPPMYTNYVQLTIDSPGRGSIVERTNYRQSLSDSEYYFLKKFFAGFKTVCIRKLNFGPETFYEPVRFPFIPKLFSIRHLEISGNVKQHLNFLTPLLVNHSMETLVIQKQSPGGWLRHRAEYNHLIIKSAKALVISGHAVATCLLELSNKEVVRKMSRFTIEQAEHLIANWRINQYPIGRKYSIEMYDKRTVIELMRGIRLIPGAVRGKIEESRETLFPRCITFPISNFEELNFYARTNLFIDPQLIRTPDWKMLYYVIFQIHRKGHATPL